MTYRFRAYLLATACSLCSFYAYAEDVTTQDKDVMWFDQSYKIMTCNLETTDSKCIGNPISPLCAVETEIAQHKYDDKRVHDIAYGKMPGPIENLMAPPNCTSQLGYRIYATRHFIRLIDIPRPQFNMFGVKQGDVAINIQLSAGCENRNCPPQEVIDNWNDRSYLLRKGDYGWHVVPVSWETGIDTRGVDYTNPDDLRWTCPGWPNGWTGPGPFPDHCPEPPK
jgi:hypothetical protein